MMLDTLSSVLLLMLSTIKERRHRLMHRIRTMNRQQLARGLVAFGALALMLMVMAAPMTSYAQTAVPPPQIEIDMAPLFNGISTYVPLFMGILSTPGSITIAIAIVGLVIFLIIKAFQSARKGGGD